MVVIPIKVPVEHGQLSYCKSMEDEHEPTPEILGSKRKRRSIDDDSSNMKDGELKKTVLKYKCRFCGTPFDKAQALGGHMNRHRQERENEQLENAQQLVSSMTQQQFPRSWTTMTLENLATDAAAHWARLSMHPLSGPGDFGSSSRLQLPPQISLTTPRLPNMARALLSAPSVTSPDSSSTNFYMPSNSSISNLQHPHWDVDASFPRSASLNMLDSMTGAIREDFLSSMVQLPSGYDSLGCQAQLSPMSLLNSRQGDFQVSKRLFQDLDPYHV